MEDWMKSDHRPTCQLASVNYNCTSHCLCIVNYKTLNIDIHSQLNYWPGKYVQI